MRWLAFAALASMASLGRAEVKVEQVTFQGWKDAYRISNGTVELVVVPAIGRVVSYGYTGEANVLWLNDALVGKTFAPDPQTYRNYGGDKLWIAPRKLWNWPPDPTLDGGPWTATRLPNGVDLRSPIGSPIKAELRRQITLDDQGTEVIFQNSLTNRGPRTEMTLWQQTQLQMPTEITMGTLISAPQPRGYVLFGGGSLNDRFERLDGNRLVISPDAARPRRFGSTTPDGRLTAAIRNVRFISEASTLRTTYPDAAAQQVNIPAAEGFVEFGQLGVLQRLEVGEATLLTVHWRLARG